MTTVTKDQVMKVLPPLIMGDREFHTPELADAISKEVGAKIKSDTARYWANQLCLDGVLDRRPISARLFVYFRAKAKGLPSSLTIRKPD
jgi:hypothetical protein